MEIYIDEHADERLTRAEGRLHTNDPTQLVGSGTAHRHPGDAEVAEIGDELTVARALSDLTHQLLHDAAKARRRADRVGVVGWSLGGYYVPAPRRSRRGSPRRSPGARTTSGARSRSDGSSARARTTRRTTGSKCCATTRPPAFGALDELTVADWDFTMRIRRP